MAKAILDLNYEEDKLVTVDFNLVATEDGEFAIGQNARSRTKRHRRIDRRATRCFSLNHGFASGVAWRNNIAIWASNLFASLTYSR